MQHPFEVLKPDYEADLARMVVIREAEVDEVARKLGGFVTEGKYEQGFLLTAVPQPWEAASFEREASSNFKLSPAQGDPIDEVSNHVPKGLGPYASWIDALVAAYKIDGLDAVGAGNWSWARGCYEGELFNGFGYRARGVRTPYLWSGTNLYVESKFDEDGHFNSTLVDKQLGIVPVMARLVQLLPALAPEFADALPASGKAKEQAPNPTLPLPLRIAAARPAVIVEASPSSYIFHQPSAVAPSIPKPAPVPLGHHDAAALQDALNKIGADPVLRVDDSYGRATRRAVVAFQQAAGLQVDGIAGPATWDAISKRLAA